MKKLVIIFTMFVLTLNTAQAAIKISPASIELDANKSKKDYLTGSFDVSGGKDEVVRFKITSEFFEHNNKGYYVSLPDKNQPNSLVGKVKFYPTEFTCQNGTPQKVRFTVTDVKTLPSGESRIALFLEDVKTKELLIKRADGSIGGRITVKTRVAVPVYVNKGNYVKKGTLETAAMKKIDDEYGCEYKVSSTGNSKILCSGLVYISQGDKLISKTDIPGSSVEGGKSLEKIQRLDIPKDALSNGQEYKIKLILKYSDENEREKNLKREFTFIPEKVTQSQI